MNDKEGNEIGKVKFSVYKFYFQAIGFWPILFLLCFFFFSMVAQVDFFLNKKKELTCKINLK